ncbi:MAG TPA: GAF domain-containing sensor histidine kinase [Gemmatimonadaceae bacterium]|nr:GAF domain-containing sensor histidine kinase [Gemmatimonadaceae bacterium]
MRTEPTAPVPPPPADLAMRELMAVREIVHAFLTADRPEEVYQFALERVRPLLGATFACVYLLDGSDDVMRLAAACNWPERYRPFLGQMRVRLGAGPSGLAASTRAPVVVPDVFADASLAEWQEVATELGFRSLVALPLQTPTRVLGTATFYFAQGDPLRGEEDGLLRIVADQMAATAEKALLIHELRRANAALSDTNAELERQIAAVNEARRLKDEFLSNISHELRTPLTAVLGYAAVLEEGAWGPLTDEQRATLRAVTAASERLLGLIEDLLELSTLRRGELRVQVDTFDMCDVVREVVSDAAPPAGDVALRMELPAGTLPLMRSDRRKVTKILGNLVSNALKFTPRGEVAVSLAATSDGFARFGVRDTGIGIDAAAQQLVFDEFRQVDGSRTREHGGSGLGLALSRQLARLLGGDIEVSSTPGEGSAFIVELPLEYAPDLSHVAAVREPLSLPL